jgi:hypothetical protein
VTHALWQPVQHHDARSAEHEQRSGDDHQKLVLNHVRSEELLRRCMQR